MSVLLELADRCEQATGDDMLELINLECDICAALGIETGSHETPFTSSIDAAMTLVPCGFEHYGFDRNLKDDILSARHVTTQAFVDDGAADFSKYFRAEAATAALALCAAALHARSAIAPEAATAAETVQLGSVHEGAGRNGIAQTPIPSSRERK